MPTRRIFYSFHYDNDVMRVQLIRNIGALEGNEPVSKNDWETVKKGGEKAIKKWIADNMDRRTCVVVLIGEETANRPWVKYEIQKAWEDGRALLGIYINNIKDPNTGTCGRGANPFDQFTFSKNGKTIIPPCKVPSASDAYNDIRNNMEAWIEDAIAKCNP